jgi:hypothetical protein
MSDSPEHNSDFLDSSPKENYERMHEKKLSDFLSGIVLNIVIVIAGYLLYLLFFYHLLNSFSFLWYVPVFLPVIAAIFYFVRGRKYFGFGVIGGYIVMLLLVVLVFGACIIISL